MDFQNFQKSNFDGGKFLKIWSFIGYKQTNKQTNRQTDRQAKFIYRLSSVLSPGHVYSSYSEKMYAEFPCREKNIPQENQKLEILDLDLF